MVVGGRLIFNRSVKTFFRFINWYFLMIYFIQYTEETEPADIDFFETRNRRIRKL